MEFIQAVGGIAFFLLLVNILTLGISNIWLGKSVKDMIARRDYKIPFLAAAALVGTLEPKAGFALLALGCAVHVWSTGRKLSNSADAAAAEEELSRQRARDTMREPGDWRP